MRNGVQGRLDGTAPDVGAVAGGRGVADAYAAALLQDVDEAMAPGPRSARAHSGSIEEPHPDFAWAHSGAMSLTGPADGPPRLAPGPLASCARGAVAGLATLVAPEARASIAALDGPALLGERAAALGLERRGGTAPGGSCRMLRAADGWLALNLARDDDRRLLPAWLEVDARPGESAWEHASRGLRGLALEPAIARARLMGLAVAAVGPAAEREPSRSWLRVAARGPGRDSAAARPLVIDLSSLWAGPLCGHLLGLAGARVVKVESRERPDGARSGPPAFFDLLNAGKRSVVLPLRDEAGLDALRGLIRRADVVVESARPRALRQLGIRAEDEVARRPGLTWVSVTGYGREEPEASWVAFGDDAAAAAGAVSWDGARSSEPHFCGDALADPLTGLHAALAAQASVVRGGGHLLDVALRDVTAHALCFAPHAGCGAAEVVEGAAGFEVRLAGRSAPVAPPRARTAVSPARTLGADTTPLLAEHPPAC